jgi:hypothetical protein
MRNLSNTDYVRNFYLIPLNKALKSWKIWIVTIIYESLFLFFVAMIGKYFMVLSNMFSQKALEVDVENAVQLFANVADYNADIATALLAFIILLVVYLVIVYFLYAITRTFIWNRLYNKKNFFARNMILDLILYAIFILLALFGIFYVKESFLVTYFLIYSIPLFIFSFFCHL